MHTSGNSHRQARATGHNAWRHLIRSSGTQGTFLQNSKDQWLWSFYSKSHSHPAQLSILPGRPHTSIAPDGWGQSRSSGGDQGPFLLWPWYKRDSHHRRVSGGLCGPHLLQHLISLWMRRATGSRPRSAFPLPPPAPHIPSHLRREGQRCLSINFSHACFPHLFSFLIYPWLLKGLIRKMWAGVGTSENNRHFPIWPLSPAAELTNWMSSADRSGTWYEVHYEPRQGLCAKPHLNNSCWLNSSQALPPDTVRKYSHPIAF